MYSDRPQFKFLNPTESLILYYIVRTSFLLKDIFQMTASSYPSMAQTFSTHNMGNVPMRPDSMSKCLDENYVYTVISFLYLKKTVDCFLVLYVILKNCVAVIL